VRRLAEGSLTALLDGHLVLLYPGSGDGAAEWFREVAALARALAPASRARAIAAEGPVGVGGLSAAVAGLARLQRFGSRSGGDVPLIWAREYALDSLLHGRVEPAAGTEFVEQHLGPLIEWDREHGTDLLGVLETALDFPRHDRAAERCFMHRNTFRHRLRQATELLGERLDSPDVRLAVHVALKLRRLAEARNGGATHARP
jgi:sugar diacid utilization regulator